MQIIPVIDLKNGHVVSAQRGNRSNYQPIKSALCYSSLLEDVVHDFLSLYPFEKIYIADLNAITQSGNHRQLIDKVVSKYRSVEFWVDNGCKIQAPTVITNQKYRLVIGSENQNNANIHHINTIKNYILSLDFFPTQGYTGPLELMENSNLWPRDIIIMSLDHVGSNNGPDFKRLLNFLEKYPKNNIIAAGGIRNEMDLLQLNKMGVNYALIASALHSGEINNKTIKKLISIR